MSAAKKVVIVEDDSDVRYLYQRKLEIEGFTVYAASDGAAGLAVIKQVRPDIVLVDLLMPIMSGSEMLAQLRAEEWASDIRVIVLTNISKDEAPPALRFLNVDRYVVKAYHTPAQAAGVVHEVLGTRAP